MKQDQWRVSGVERKRVTCCVIVFRGNLWEMYKYKSLIVPRSRLVIQDFLCPSWPLRSPSKITEFVLQHICILHVIFDDQQPFSGYLDVACDEQNTSLASK